MKEIKLKPETSRPKVLESAARAPKTAMRETWLKSKEKTVSELKETPFAGQMRNPPILRPTAPRIRQSPV